MNDSRAVTRWRRRRHAVVDRRLAVTLIVALVAVSACSSSDDAGSVGASVASATSLPAPTAPTDTADPATSAPHSNGPASSVPAGTGAPDRADADFSAITPVVQAYLDEHAMNGAGLVVVDREEGVIHEEYWGEFDADRVSLIASSSKMIVAGVLMHLDDVGLLDVDAPVAEAVGWGAGNPTITPAQLISNSSGLVGLLPEPAYAPYVCQFLPGGTLQDCAATIFTTGDDDADVVAPDTEQRYGGAQWQVAGAVAEAVSGKSWADLIDEIYVQPCGVGSLAFNNHWTQFSGGDAFAYPAAFDSDPSTLQPTENPNLEGGAYITAPDYAALLLMHLRDGYCGDIQVLSADALATMHSDRTGAVYDSTIAYGMGWWVDAEHGRISDPGAFGATPWLDLDDGYGAYLVVEGDTGPGLANELYDLVERAVHATVD